jgi:hypothetical protein
LNEELTVYELPIIEQAVMHLNVNLPRSPHVKEEGPMGFARPQGLQTPGNMKNIVFGLQGRILELKVRNGLSLFFLVNPAQFDSMYHDYESVALNMCSASYDGSPCCVLL